MWGAPTLSHLATLVKYCIRQRDEVAAIVRMCVTGLCDDIVLSARRTVDEMERRCNEAPIIVSEKIKVLGFKLAVGKTEAVLFTHKYKYVIPRIVIENQVLVIVIEIIYFGLVIEKGFLFKSHSTKAVMRTE